MSFFQKIVNAVYTSYDNEHIKKQPGICNKLKIKRADFISVKIFKELIELIKQKKIIKYIKIRYFTLDIVELMPEFIEALKINGRIKILKFQNYNDCTIDFQKAISYFLNNISKIHSLMDIEYSFDRLFQGICDEKTKESLEVICERNKEIKAIYKIKAYNICEIKEYLNDISKKTIIIWLMIARRLNLYKTIKYEIVILIWISIFRMN
jgi:histidyl-tRNA synthetase